MPAQILTQVKLQEILDYDPDTGLFRWKVRLAICVTIGGVAGSISRYGYRIISMNGKRYRAHRLAWLYVFGELPLDQLDHINGICDDNRIENLRACSHKQNQENRTMNSNNKSGYTGVYRNKNRGKKWVAQISHNGKRHYIGHFDDPKDAYGAYLDAKARLHTHQPVPRL